jgi:uncharacterized protein (TIGR01777 family)
MRILVAGGTGFIGAALIQELSHSGHTVVALVRNMAASEGMFPPGTERALWDGRSQGAWRDHVATVDAVFNFSGASIGGGRWNQRRKKLIVESRVAPTRTLVDAMRASAHRPRVFINASAVGYYGVAGDDIVTEDSSPANDFLARTCQLWEAEALAASPLGVRVVLPRLGVVLAKGGGVLERLVVPFKLFVGGPLGTGRQWYPWVHRDDLLSALSYLLHHEGFEGGVNVVSPETVTMSTFARELGAALGRPSGITVPSFVLRAAFGEMAGIILEGRRIIPARLLAAGFAFKYPTLRAALTAIVGPASV